MINQLESGTAPGRGSGDERLREENAWLTLELFNELVHTGMQASLPADPRGGFRQRPSSHDPEVVRAAEIANLPYQHAPDGHKRTCAGISQRLTAFLSRLYREDTVIDDAVYLEGREAVYNGMVHGKFGNPFGIYEDWEGADDKKLQEVMRRLGAYDEFVSPELQRADENIVNLGFLAMRRPTIFPWVADRFWYPGDDVRHMTNTDMLWVDDFACYGNLAQDPGISEGELRGLAAIRRVVRVRGHATELQAALLAHPDDGVQ